MKKLCRKAYNRRPELQSLSLLMEKRVQGVSNLEDNMNMQELKTTGNSGGPYLDLHLHLLLISLLPLVDHLFFFFFLPFVALILDKVGDHIPFFSLQLHEK